MDKRLQNLKSFKKGQSGNLKGRPVGLAITVKKEGVEKLYQVFKLLFIEPEKAMIAWLKINQDSLSVVQKLLIDKIARDRNVHQAWMLLTQVLGRPHQSVSIEEQVKQEVQTMTAEEIKSELARLGLKVNTKSKGDL